MFYMTNKWHAHTCTILCFRQSRQSVGGWAVQTNLYWHLYLSTEVNSFTLGTQNGAMTTKQTKLESFTSNAMATIYPWTSQDSFIFHPTRWKSTTSHENILAVQSRYVRLSNSTICAWPQYLCCAYFQKPSLPWLFSIMYRLISPTYKRVQRMSKAHSRHELHQSSICQIVCSDALLNCTVLLKLQKFAMSTITAVQSSQC